MRGRQTRDARGSESDELHDRKSIKLSVQTYSGVQTAQHVQQHNIQPRSLLVFTGSERGSILHYQTHYIAMILYTGVSLIDILW